MTMTFTARIASASFFALASIHSIGSATATEAKPDPDPQLCAEYLRDLATYRRMAVLLGCQIPESGDQVAATEPGDTQFPPVVADEPAPSNVEFPPVVNEPAASETETNVPPVEEASAEPASEDFPPVAAESSSGSGSASRSDSGGGSSSFPPVLTSSADIPDEGFEDPADPVRAAIEEKLTIFKEEVKARVEEAVIMKAEEVKARVKDAVIMKAEEVKERVKEKIKHKIEDAIAQHHNNDGAPTLRRAAKDAVKRMISERHHGGSILSKLSQLRRR
jgi:hypothetical protein